jgi:anthranilate phosphoribosyltransferase
MSAVPVQDIVAGRTLTRDESKQLMHAIVAGDIPPAQVAALLTIFAVRGIDVDLLDGFVTAARELAVPLDLGAGDLIDVCGTGGDGKSSFNISTASAFVIAGAGYRVAKHGNVGVSSLCGSSTVLQELGVVLSADRDHLQRSLDLYGVCFIHAPLFHPAFKRVASIRAELGFRTVFNALGPLINPASIQFRYTGVYNLELQRMYSYLLRRRGERFAVVHALDGYDEVSLTGSSRVVADSGAWELDPEDLGMATVLPSEIAAPATSAESAMLIEQILRGKSLGGRAERMAQRDVVIANAAVALWSYEGAKRELAHYCAVARESIESGRAYKVLQGCREV